MVRTGFKIAVCNIVYKSCVLLLDIYVIYPVCIYSRICAPVGYTRLRRAILLLRKPIFESFI